MNAAGKLLRSVVLVLAAVSARPELAAAQKKADPLAGLDAYAQAALSALRVPGLAIAVVRNDSVVYSRGFGVRVTGTKDLVDDRTLFALGSTGKAFTAAAVAALVSDGKMHWDDPLSRRLPGFRLHDPYLTATVTVRDALSHRTGLPRGDLIWIGAGGISRADVLERVRYLEPTFGLRSHWGYSNIMYLAAGEAAGAVSGIGYDELVRSRLLQPLGMTSTVVNPSTIEG
ncbi:MAG: serine hydrolase domain-containing protein, partial [Gemmatimonadales bacterium]